MYDINIVNDKNPLVDIIDEINLETDVIISVPANIDIVKFNIDGRIGICPEEQVNLSFAKQITGFIPTVREMTKKLPIKLFIPYGYQPEFQSPRNNLYLDVKTTFTSYSGFIHKNDFRVGKKDINIYSKNPNYIVYTDFSVQLIINSELCKKTTPMMTISKGSPICELGIIKNFANTFGSGKIYYVQNDEVFFKLEDGI